MHRNPKYSCNFAGCMSGGVSLRRNQVTVGTWMMQVSKTLWIKAHWLGAGFITTARAQIQGQLSRQQLQQTHHSLNSSEYVHMHSHKNICFHLHTASSCKSSKDKHLSLMTVYQSKSQPPWQLCYFTLKNRQALFFQVMSPHNARQRKTKLLLIEYYSRENSHFNQHKEVNKRNARKRMHLFQNLTKKNCKSVAHIWT